MAYRNGEIFVGPVLTTVTTIKVLDYATGAVKRTMTTVTIRDSLAADADYLYAADNRTLYRLDPLTGAVLGSGTLEGVGAIEGLAVVGEEIVVGTNARIQFFDRITFAALRTYAPAVPIDVEALGGDGDGFPGDFYRLSLDAGVAFQTRTSTPADGSGDFVNRLDAHLRLYDAAGNLVASDDNSAADGRNALLNFTPAVGGTYYLAVGAGAAAVHETARGEYRLHFSTGTAPPAVVGVYARGTAWQSAFLDHLDAAGLDTPRSPGSVSGSRTSRRRSLGRTSIPSRSSSTDRFPSASTT